MLKSKYTTLTEIPEGDRQHYQLQDGTYVLQLDTDHPVLVKKNELLAQHVTDKAELTRLSGEVGRLGSELTNAKSATGLPAGHVAMPAARAASLDIFEAMGTPDVIKAKLKDADAFVALGKKPDEIKSALEEHGALKAANAAFEKQKHFSEVASLLNYDPEILSTLPGIGEIEFEIKTSEKDGKAIKEVNAKFKEDGKDVVKTASDFIPTKWPKYLPALETKTPKGTRMVKQGNSDKPAPENKYDKIRAETRERQKAAQSQGTTLEQRLNMTQPG